MINLKKMTMNVYATIKDEMKSWQESCDYYDSGKPNWDPFKF